MSEKVHVSKREKREIRIAQAVARKRKKAWRNFGITAVVIAIPIVSYLLLK